MNFDYLGFLLAPVPRFTSGTATKKRLPIFSIKITESYGDYKNN